MIKIKVQGKEEYECIIAEIMKQAKEYHNGLRPLPVICDD